MDAPAFSARKPWTRRLFYQSIFFLFLLAPDWIVLAVLFGPVCPGYHLC